MILPDFQQKGEYFTVKSDHIQLKSNKGSLISSFFNLTINYK